MSECRHTIHMPDGTRVEVLGDRYEVYLAKPIIVHRKHWICHLSAAEETKRSMLYSTACDGVTKAIETAFRTIPQVIYRDGHD